MRKSFVAVIATIATLALAGVAAAALVPGVYDPGHTHCPTATYSNGVLHLAKPCVTTTNAAAGADITGAEGQTFQSASFTLANATQCQGGSPRFNVTTTTGTFFLGCNNVVGATNGDGTVTYTFTPATIAAGGQPVPTGTIQSVSVLIDVQGTADLSNITFNGVAQTVTTTSHGKNIVQTPCLNGGWKTFTSPTFKNQGQCVKYMVHARHAARKAAHHAAPKHHTK
jgi:hypothetical protein